MPITHGSSQELTPATTIRTYQADDGLLHLRIRRPDGSLRELLFVDITGEHFERIREGTTTLLEELPWAACVDRFLVIIDGRAYATLGEREVVLNRVQRQIFALDNGEAVNVTSRVAIVLTKLDELSEGQRDEYMTLEETLLEGVRRIDEQARAFRIAARPADGTSALGLDALVEWLCGEDRVAAKGACVSPTRPSRAIGRFIS